MICPYEDCAKETELTHYDGYSGQCEHCKRIIIAEEVKELNKEITFDVPSLDLVDFSKYKEVLKNTHKHLPVFNLVENELGLIGEEYYAAKKAINYKLESQKQNTIVFKVGSEYFDNRIHLAFIGGAGTGKGKIKAAIRTHHDVVECSGNRTNIEQLIGKKKIVKGQEVELKGYFGYKELIVDESQGLVKEDAPNLAAIMREIRIAMDIYTFNQSEKKLVDTDLLTYSPETRFTLMMHNLVFPPVFFDTGTFRRMFCFKLNQTQIKEHDTVANLYRESREKELKDYMQENVFYEPNTLKFNKEAIDELVDFFLTWNKFVFLNPSQRVRSVAKGLVFSAKTYFFRLSAILAINRNETDVSKKTIQLACIDTIHFLLDTIENYSNNSNPTLSRDVWRSENIADCMLFE